MTVEAPRPTPAAGLELIGRYEGSGLRKPIYLARRADGRMLQLSTLLFALASRIDGRRTVDQLASAVSADLGRSLTPDDVEFLVTGKLEPIGVVAPRSDVAGTARPATSRGSDDLLGLRLRAAVVPERAVLAVASVLRPLFAWPVVITALLAVAAMDGWLLFVHGVAGGVRQAVVTPEAMLPLLAAIVLSTAAHELGHATACRYGGARPGRIGVGLYLVWPVFYSDVTDSYRLGRVGRLRTDLGGVYFNLLFTLLLMGAFLLTGFEALIVAIVLIQVDVLHQFFPFFRLDGYYVFSDLVGVPDLFTRIRPTLASLLPGRRRDPRAAELRPWARAAVTAWVLLTVATVGFFYLVLVSGLPRLVATAMASFGAHWSALVRAVGAGDVPMAALSAVQEVLLVLPLVALAYTTGTAAAAVSRAGWRLSAGWPAARVAVGVAAVAAVAFGAWMLWPREQYRPIPPGERGTIANLPPALGGAAAPAARPGGGARVEPSGAPATVVPAAASPTGTPAPSAAPVAGQPVDGAAGVPAPAVPTALPKPPVPTPALPPVPTPIPALPPAPVPTPSLPSLP